MKNLIFDVIIFYGFYENCFDIECIHLEGKHHLIDVQEHYKDWYKYEDEEKGSWYNIQRQGNNKDCLKQEDEELKDDIE